jgi:hypothetical protein
MERDVHSQIESRIKTSAGSELNANSDALRAARQRRAEFREQANGRRGCSWDAPPTVILHDERIYVGVNDSVVAS